MKARNVLLTAVLLSAAVEVQARVHTPLTYEQLKAKASLIVVAAPMKVAVTAERGLIPGGQTRGKGLETTFKVLTVLKGEPGAGTVILHHYAYDQSVITEWDAWVVSFEPENKKQYLMFLQKEPDGRYAPVSGQYEPAESILTVGPGQRRMGQMTEPNASPNGGPAAAVSNSGVPEGRHR